MLHIFSLWWYHFDIRRGVVRSGNWCVFVFEISCILYLYMLDLSLHIYIYFEKKWPMYFREQPRQTSCLCFDHFLLGHIVRISIVFLKQNLLSLYIKIFLYASKSYLCVKVRNKSGCRFSPMTSTCTLYCFISYIYFTSYILTLCNCFLSTINHVLFTSQNKSINHRLIHKTSI